MKKRKSVKQLKKQLDTLFSRYIVKRDKGICITCGGEGNQAGHYFSRSYTYLRYDPWNVNAQCVSCNVFKHGNIGVYTIRLIEKYGVDVLGKLQATYHLEKRFTPKELEDLIQKYGSRNKN